MFGYLKIQVSFVSFKTSNSFQTTAYLFPFFQNQTLLSLPPALFLPAGCPQPPIALVSFADSLSSWLGKGPAVPQHPLTLEEKCLSSPHPGASPYSILCLAEWSAAQGCTRLTAAHRMRCQAPSLCTPSFWFGFLGRFLSFPFFLGCPPKREREREKVIRVMRFALGGK